MIYGDSPSWLFLVSLHGGGGGGGGGGVPHSVAHGR